MSADVRRENSHQETRLRSVAKKRLLVERESGSLGNAVVRDNDAFWKPRQETNRRVPIPVNLENLVKAGNIRNFELAATKPTEGYMGPVFMRGLIQRGHGKADVDDP